MELGIPDHFLGVDAFTVHHCGDLPVGAACVKADAAAVHVAAHGLRLFIGGGAAFQRQVQDFQVPLVELVHKGEVKVPLTFGGVGLLEPLRQLGAAADGHPEAAGGPEQELDVTFYIPIIGLGHIFRAVDEGVVDRYVALIPLNGDGNGLFCILQVGGAPDAEGNEFRVQLGGVFHIVGNAKITHE